MVDVHTPRSPSEAESGTESFYSEKGVMKVFGIPELLALFCGFLSIQAFVNLALASHEFYALFTPYVWREIAITTAAQEACFTTDAAKMALKKYKNFVHSFETSLPVALKTFIKAFQPSSFYANDKFNMAPTNLRTLKLSWKNPEIVNRSVYFFGGHELFNPRNYPQAVSWDESVIFLARNSPRLRELDVSLSQVRRFDLNNEGRLQRRSQSSSRKLDRLRICASDVRLADFAVLLGALPEQVKDLELDIEISTHEVGDHHGEIPAPRSNHEKHPSEASHEKLTLHGSILGAPEHIQRRIYKRCGELSILKLTNKLRNIDVMGTGAMFRLLCPKLEHLEIDTSDHRLTDESIAGLISSPIATPVVASPAMMPTPPLTPTHTSPLESAPPSSPGSPSATESPSLAALSSWRSIAIKAPGFGPLSSASIVRHAFSLESVTLVDRGLEVGDLLHLLSTAPRLRKLVSLSKRGPRHNVTFLKPAMIAHGAPWACSDTLEELCVSLRPGPSSACNRNALLCRIAAMANLRILHLHNGVQRKLGFSDFSLDPTKGGLERLQGLKSLEAFEIGNFKHHIGQEERAWMAKQWPRLKRISTDCEYDDHSAAKRRRAAQ